MTKIVSFNSAGSRLFNNFVMHPPVSLVWFKRDLRLSDHEPLEQAIAAGLPVLLVYCFEPSWMRAPDSDERHWRFVRESLEEMQRRLAPRGIPLYVFCAEVLEVLDALRLVVDVKAIFSHEETGNRITFDRDRAVAAFCRQHGIAWHEAPTGGVTRRLYHRNGWEKTWVERMSRPLAEPDWAHFKPFHLPAEWLAAFPQRQLPAGVRASSSVFQPGGETAAWRYLDSFLYERGRQYFRNISKPEAARRSCSRISPYLTWGNLSMRQVWQATRTATERTGDRYNLGAFTSRLFWHCHFIQKFETECRMEFENLNRGFDAIRTEVNEAWVAAWREGRTGVPLVDACMRCVTATGYLNFRMRSMLVSFLTHHLWQPWQVGVHHLAQQFLDYEPGIHYSQFQMQAGTMGVNTVRIYNPVKQAAEHDPESLFIKKWVPELVALPAPFAREPWRMTPLEATFYGFRPGQDYPLPLVDLEKAAAHARDRLWTHKKDPAVRAENQRILRVHTKRRRAEETTVMGDAATVEQLLREAAGKEPV